MARAKNRAQPASELRIIGGQWRSRKLAFTPAQGLRPTSDRIRETLFNWLAPALRGARTLDLFAGSGALGLESLSRGASHCDFVDTSRTALSQISQHLNALEASRHGSCHLQRAEQFLHNATGGPYNIVFIDPPFGLELVEQACQLLSKPSILAPQAWIYLETPRDQAPPPVPDSWVLHRDKKAGEVAYRLFLTR
jgi:16S rRNA (guanine966-N2)-methyltransferase